MLTDKQEPHLHVARNREISPKPRLINLVMHVLNLPAWQSPNATRQSWQRLGLVLSGFARHDGGIGPFIYSQMP
jgi:hypothetical protein